MFVLTLLLQAGLGQQPFHAGVETLPLAVTFTTASILGPRFAARLGSRSITLGALLAALGTLGLVLTGHGAGGQLNPWELAPASAFIGVGQGIALPSLMGVVLQHIRPERAGAAAGVLTTTQQFGIASGVAVVGAVFYGALGGLPSRGTFVSAMEVAMTIDVVVLAIAAAITMILPRRAASAAARSASASDSPASDSPASAAAADRPVHVAE